MSDFNTPDTPASFSASEQRVLIVASDDADIDVLEKVASESGHAVKIATDGKTALIALDEFQPALVFMELYLPDMTAHELTEILRGAAHYASRFRHVPILYVAERHRVVMHRMVNLPDSSLADYLFKPLDPKAVQERMERAFDKK